MYFKVKSQTDPGQKGGYKVSLDNEHGMPSCECHSWMWNLHPCKHIFAVINSTNASWENLPQHYRSSPYFTIDLKVMGFPVAVSSEGDEEEEVEEMTEEDHVFEEAMDGLVELPSAKKGPKSLKSLAIECREKLSLIQNATYLCQSYDALLELNVKLNDAFSYINENLYKDSGICTETTEEKKQKKKQKPHRKMEKTKPSYDSQEVKSTTHIIEVEEREKKKKSSKTDLKRKRPSLKLKKEGEKNTSTETVIVEGHGTIPRTIQEQLNGKFLI